ncbi:MAG TPA: hypothetical protein VH079_00445 [Terriglobales bacterium]|nr:hypothetical protein [Terriglobales bacterium]
MRTQRNPGPTSITAPKSVTPQPRKGATQLSPGRKALGQRCARATVEEPQPRLGVCPNGATTQRSPQLNSRQRGKDPLQNQPERATQLSPGRKVLGNPPQSDHAPAWAPRM